MKISVKKVDKLNEWIETLEFLERLNCIFIVKKIY